MRALDRIRDELKKTTTRNDAQKSAIITELNQAPSLNSGYSEVAKIEIKKLRDEFAQDFKVAETAKINAVAQTQVAATADVSSLKVESVYNSPLLK